jgi:hypothetical protein
MDEITILKKLEKVKAPPDFEQQVMARLSLRRRSLRRQQVGFRLSLAGAFASLILVFVLLNVFVLQNRAPLGVSQAESARSGAAAGLQPGAGFGQTIPIIETLDYSSEIRSRSLEPEAIYLLEQVSDTTPKGVKF